MKNEMSVRGLIIAIILVMLISNQAFASDDAGKTLIIMLDSISFDEIEALDVDGMAIGLVNLKTRKPYKDEALYRSLNVGRKLSPEDGLDEDLNLEYLGDILRKERPKLLAFQEDKLSILLEDSKARSNIERLDTKEAEDRVEALELAYKDSNIVSMGLDLRSSPGDFDLLDKIIKSNRDKRIYLLVRDVHPKDAGILNQFLAPLVVIDGEDGILTSDSTKREGIVAIEDFAVDLKAKYGHINKLDIGESYEKIKTNDPLGDIRAIYEENISLLVLAWICHGLIYFSQILMAYKIFTGKKLGWVDAIFIFANNNILLTSILSFIFTRINIYLYVFILLGLNIVLTSFFLERRDLLNLSLIFNYLLIVFISFFNLEYIYNSYMGFNNIVYGARFYGFNNGMAAVLLGTSIYLISYLDRNLSKSFFKKLAIAMIPILNTVILSARISANTGSFITSLAMCLVVFYYYLMEERLEFKSLLFFIFLTIPFLGINIYLDILKNENSHFLQFVYRLQENGLKELYYMAGFKLKELLKLTLMPPFSLVLMAQGFIIYNRSQELRKSEKSLIILGLLGFFINDTGNILLIYMLNYLILSFIITDGLNQEDELKRRKLYC